LDKAGVVEEKLQRHLEDLKNTRNLGHLKETKNITD